MRIEKVRVTYGELRSQGAPVYTNQRYEVSYEAQLDPGESANDVRRALTDTAKGRVLDYFNSLITYPKVKDFQDPDDIPF